MKSVDENKNKLIDGRLVPQELVVQHKGTNKHFVIQTDGTEVQVYTAATLNSRKRKCSFDIIQEFLDEHDITSFQRNTFFYKEKSLGLLADVAATCNDGRQLAISLDVENAVSLSASP